MTRKMKYIASVDANFTPAPTHRFSYHVSKKYIQNKKVLDVGCWNGDFQTLVDVKCKMVGIDPDADALRVAKKRTPQFTFKKADVLKRLPFRKEFDTVVCWMTMEHISDQRLALININRVMKKNGIIFISTPAFTFRSLLFDLPYVLLGHHHFRGSKFSKWFENSGFKVERVQVLGSYFVALRISFLLFYKYLLGKPLPPLQWLEKRQMKEYGSGQGFNELFIRARKVKDA